MWQTSDTTRRARRLRRDMTPAEAVLWNHVRDRRFETLKFRRESPVAGSVCDFVCLELRLIVELDGGVHRLHEEDDAARDARLTRAGFTVIRIANQTFMTNPNILFDRIRAHARLPSPLGGEGGSRSETVEGAARPETNRRTADLMTQPPHPSGSAAHLLPRGEKEARPPF